MMKNASFTISTALQVLKEWVAVELIILCFRDFEDIFGDFGGVFENFFGGGRRRSSRTASGQGESLRYDLEIDFKEAVYGTKAK